MTPRLSALALVASLILAGCGGDESEPAAAPTQTPAAEVTPEPKPEPKPAETKGTEDCGDAPAPTDGGDQPTNVKATGIRCDEAVKVAAKVQAAMDSVDGWDCPAISEYAQASQECTKGAATVAWTVKWL